MSYLQCLVYITVISLKIGASALGLWHLSGLHFLKTVDRDPENKTADAAGPPVELTGPGELCSFHSSVSSPEARDGALVAVPSLLRVHLYLPQAGTSLLPSPCSAVVNLEKSVDIFFLCHKHSLILSLILLDTILSLL